MEEYFCDVIHKRKNHEIVLKQGSEPYYYAYVLLSGKANVYKDVEGEQVLAGIVREGEIFGILSFISNNIRSATIIANGDVTVGIIMKDTFVQHNPARFLHEHNHFSVF